MMENLSSQLYEMYNSGTIKPSEVQQEENKIQTCNNWIVPFVLFVTLTILMKVNDTKWSKISHIPGPWMLPGIGTLHKIGFNPHTAFKALGRKYGNIFRVKIGSKEIVVLRGLDTIKCALQKTDDFSGRPFLFTFQYLSNGQSLSFSDYDQTFKRHKQLAEWSLNKYITTADVVNTTVRYEAQELAKHFLSFSGKPVDPNQPVLWAVGHVLYNICFGDSRKEKQDFEALINGSVSLISMHKCGNIANFIPLARKLLNWKVQEIKDTCRCMCQISVNKEQEHLKTFQPGYHRNTLDFLVEASHQNTGKIDEDRVLHTCQDFLGAGLDIVHASLTWALLYLAAHEDMQERLRQELKENIQECELPRKEDGPKLPCMQAFILEVLRHSSVVPFALPHTSVKDTVLKDIPIPQGTFVMIDLYSVNRSTDLWGDPDTFRPARFLNADGQIDPAVVDMFIPFGIGRRKCLGQLFAKQEMLMFLAVVLLKCKICKPNSVADYTFESVFGLILRPKPFKIEIFPVEA